MTGIRRLDRVVDGARTTGWDLPLFGLATAVDQGGRLLVNLTAAAILGPFVFGAWVVMSLAIQYASASGLGAAQGAAREIARQAGGGRAREAHLSADHTTTWTIAGSLVLGGVTLALLLPVAGTHPTVGVATALLLAVAIALQPVFVLQQLVLRAHLRFKAASLQLAMQGVGTTVLGLATLLLGLGIDGLLGTRVSVFLLALAFAAFALPALPRLGWHWPSVRRLIAIGGPIMLAGFLLVALVTVDRWVVLALLGQEATGVYGLVGIAVGSIVALPTLVSQQFYPRLAHAMGAGDVALVHQLASQHRALSLAITLPVVGLVALAAWLGVPIWLPDYTAALVPMTITLAGVSALAYGVPYGYVLNLLDRQRVFVAVQAIALAAAVSLAVGLVVAGFGLPGVALASASAFVLYAVLVSFFGRKALAEAQPVPAGSE